MKGEILLEGIKKSFGDFCLEVDHLSITENIVISGHNGSGKSTLLKILAGFISPDIGSIKDLDSILFNNDDIGFFHHLTGLENLQFFNVDQNSLLFRKFLDELPVFRPALDIRYEEMSHGMAKVIGLFLVLAQEREVYLLDEPLSGLDEKTRSFLIREFEGQQDKIFVIAEHIANIGFEMIELSKGRVC